LITSRGKLKKKLKKRVRRKSRQAARQPKKVEEWGQQTGPGTAGQGKKERERGGNRSEKDRTTQPAQNLGHTKSSLPEKKNGP